MRDTSALISAIQENFHTIMNTTCPQERRTLIDAIWEFEQVLETVRKAMGKTDEVAA